MIWQPARPTGLSPEGRPGTGRCSTTGHRVGRCRCHSAFARRGEADPRLSSTVARLPSFRRTNSCICKSPPRIHSAKPGTAVSGHGRNCRGWQDVGRRECCDDRVRVACVLPPEAEHRCSPAAVMGVLQHFREWKRRPAMGAFSVRSNCGWPLVRSTKEKLPEEHKSQLT